MHIKQEDLRYPDFEDNFVWIDGDLHVLLNDGTKWILENAWPKSLNFDMLDYEPDDGAEEMTIECTT